jgi:hypothetical protein
MKTKHALRNRGKWNLQREVYTCLRNCGYFFFGVMMFVYKLNKPYIYVGNQVPVLALVSTTLQFFLKKNSANTGSRLMDTWTKDLDIDVGIAQTSCRLPLKEINHIAKINLGELGCATLSAKYQSYELLDFSLAPLTQFVLFLCRVVSVQHY